jgi:hypothetical protein
MSMPDNDTRTKGENGQGNEQGALSSSLPLFRSVPLPSRQGRFAFNEWLAESVMAYPIA